MLELRIYAIEDEAGSFHAELRSHEPVPGATAQDVLWSCKHTHPAGEQAETCGEDHVRKLVSAAAKA